MSTLNQALAKVVVQAPEQTEREAMQAELQRLRDENQALKAIKLAGLTCKITEKGAMSIYGLGRFPTTLYKSQWLKFFSNIDSIKAFFESNQHNMSDKAKADDDTQVAA